jgi:hypothetical protein
MKSRILRAIAAGLFVGAMLIAGTAPIGAPRTSMVMSNSGR